MIYDQKIFEATFERIETQIFIMHTQILTKIRLSMIKTTIMMTYIG